MDTGGRIIGLLHHMKLPGRCGTLLQYVLSADAEQPRYESRHRPSKRRALLSRHLSTSFDGVKMAILANRTAERGSESRSTPHPNWL
jgi:hypothetical protein